GGGGGGCCGREAAEPVRAFEWLKPGAHVTSVGSTPAGPELDPDTVVKGRLFVESRVAFSPPPAGSAELVGLDPAIATELGEVLSGAAPGRAAESEITVYKSMGHAVEDAAAARLVYEGALRDGVGRRVSIQLARQASRSCRWGHGSPQRCWHSSRDRRDPRFQRQRIRPGMRCS